MTQKTTHPNIEPNFQIEEFNKYVMNVYSRFEIAFSHGLGCKLYDLSGDEYLDFAAGIATCSLGHSSPVMVEAATSQIRKLQHVSNLFYIPEQYELAKWLVENSVGDKVFVCNSGAEANETLIKLVRKYAHLKLNQEKPVIVSAMSSFHGRTLATVTATGQPKYHKNFGPMPEGFSYINFNDLESLQNVTSELIKKNQLAGILLEPLQGEGGVIPASEEFMKAAREICTQSGALLLLDEIQIGMGRSGKLWGYENFSKVEPDVFTTAKGLGGGIPIGAVVCKSFCDVYEPGDHGSTFGGNPFASKIALMVSETINQKSFLENVAARGEQLREGLLRLREVFPNIIKSVRGWGLLNGIEVAADSGLLPTDVVRAFLKHKLVSVQAGNGVVRLAPPLIVTESEVSVALEKISKALQDLAKSKS